MEAKSKRKFPLREYKSKFILSRLNQEQTIDLGQSVAETRYTMQTELKISVNFYLGLEHVHR